MNTKKLKEMAEQEGLKTDETGKVTINPTDSVPEKNEKNVFETNTYRKKMRTLRPPREKRERVETEVIPSDLFFKTSIAGKSANITIGEIRYTLPHYELSRYMEGLTDCIRLYIIQVKQPQPTLPEVK